MNVSSFKLSSERMDRLWIVCVYIGCGGAIPLVEKWRFEQMNKSVEEDFFIDSMMVRGAELRDTFSSRFSQLSVFPWFKSFYSLCGRTNETWTCY